MKVSELATRSKVSVHRLRRYELQGLISAHRSASGYREFSEKTVREVIFIAMSRDLGFSLAEVGETLPSYRAGTLTFEQMVERMQSRIVHVDAQISAQRALREKLVSHIRWLKKRQQEFAKRGQGRPASTARPTWPTSQKEKR